MFKTITTFVLSLLLVGSSVHAASYYNTNNSEQGMCDVNCDNKKHRSSSHECDRCLNEEIQRLIISIIEAREIQDEERKGKARACKL